MTRAIIAGACLLVACDTRAPSPDSLAAAPTDTAAPVVVSASDSARRADSIRNADTIAAAAATTATKTKTSRPAATTPKTATPTRPRSDSLKLNPNIGHDSVIRRPGRMPIRPDTIPASR